MTFSHTNTSRYTSYYTATHFQHKLDYIVVVGGAPVNSQSGATATIHTIITTASIVLLSHNNSSVSPS